MPPGPGTAPVDPLSPAAWADPVAGATQLLQTLQLQGIPPEAVIGGFMALSQMAASGPPGGMPAPAAPPSGPTTGTMFGP